ncbi:hypothetical protein L3X38_029355 [Prunus dulcis]|uniref:Uncharacterized protein n=1 Tax=Prunus dulcis TaxID=3755 RepID=A0AAD4VRQ5_PRUDU|nr:hypothetical protein L3X38_029355 [Prunus dulcis]
MSYRPSKTHVPGVSPRVRLRWLDRVSFPESSKSITSRQRPPGNSPGESSSSVGPPPDVDIIPTRGTRSTVPIER